MKNHNIYTDVFTVSELRGLKQASLRSLYTTRIYTTFTLQQIKILKMFNINKCSYIEEWSQNPNLIPLPTEHYDKDEEVYDKSGELIFPLASCIIYIDIEELHGSSLVLCDCKTEILPRSNMIVKLNPGVLHKVTPYISGKRLSLNWNLW